VKCERIFSFIKQNRQSAESEKIPLNDGENHYGLGFPTSIHNRNPN